MINKGYLDWIIKNENKDPLISDPKKDVIFQDIGNPIFNELKTELPQFEKKLFRIYFKENVKKKYKKYPSVEKSIRIINSWLKEFERFPNSNEIIDFSNLSAPLTQEWFIYKRYLEFYESSKREILKSFLSISPHNYCGEYWRTQLHRRLKSFNLEKEDVKKIIKNYKYENINDIVNFIFDKYII